MFAKRFLFLAIAAVAAAVAAPATSRADFTITLSYGSVVMPAIDLTSIATFASNSGTYLGVSYSYNITNIDPGNTDAYQINAVIGSYHFVGNIDTYSSAPITVQDTSAIVYTTAVTSNALSVALSYTPFTITAPSALSVQDDLTSSNFTAGGTIAGSTAVSPFSATDPGVSINSTVESKASFVGTASSSPISVTNTVTFSGLSATTGLSGVTPGYDEYSFTSALTSATPAPSGLIIAATMIPFFGLIRRRLQSMAAPKIA
jgi:hypothetical protein